MRDATRTTGRGQREPEPRQSYGAAAERFQKEQKLGRKVVEILTDTSDGKQFVEAVHARRIWDAADALDLLPTAKPPMDNVALDKMLSDLGMAPRPVEAISDSVPCLSCRGELELDADLDQGLCLRCVKERKSMTENELRAALRHDGQDEKSRRTLAMILKVLDDCSWGAPHKQALPWGDVERYDAGAAVDAIRAVLAQHEEALAP